MSVAVLSLVVDPRVKPKGDKKVAESNVKFGETGPYTVFAILHPHKNLFRQIGSISAPGWSGKQLPKRFYLGAFCREQRVDITQSIPSERLSVRSSIGVSERRPIHKP